MPVAVGAVGGEGGQAIQSMLPSLLRGLALSSAARLGLRPPPEPTVISRGVPQCQHNQTCKPKANQAAITDDAAAEGSF
jgi:hypothetical protein